MTVRDYPLSWYVEKLRNNEPFSICTMGDGELIAAFGQNVGGQNAEGSVYTQSLCDALRESFRFQSPNFYFAMPAGLKDAALTGIGEVRIDRFLASLGVDIEFHEMDMWDREARECRFQDLFKALREKNVCIISNASMRKLHFLNYDHFIEVSYPNASDDVERVIQEAKAYGKPGVYLVLMGLSAPLVCQALHGKIENSWFLDLGSVFDASVRAGAQRGWRAELFADKDRYRAWYHKSLEGVITTEEADRLFDAL